MILSATPRLSGDDTGHARVAARVAVSAELRRAYRALGRQPAARRPAAGRGPEGDGGAAPPSSNPTDLTPNAQVHQIGETGGPTCSAPEPDGGFPVRFRTPSSDGGPDRMVEAAALVTVAAPAGTDPAWSLDLLLARSGHAFARLTLSLGPEGRSGTAETAAPLAAPSDLSAFLEGASGTGPFALAVSGASAGQATPMQCTLPNGRLRPRPQR
jgi:hypothetical protein